MKFRGIVQAVTAEETFGDDFRKRSVVLLEDNEVEYPQSIKIDFYNDRISKIADLGVSDVVEVKFNIKCKERDGKYYNSIS